MCDNVQVSKQIDFGREAGDQTRFGRWYWHQKRIVYDVIGNMGQQICQNWLLKIRYPL